MLKTYPITSPLALFGLLAVFGTPAFSCTCMSKTLPPADFGAAVVFRGTVTARKPLAVLTEMRGRGRYAIAFRVDEYWKGPRQPTVIVYGLDNGSDCLGGSGFEVGKDYLIFASEQDVFWPGGTTFWYGWTDVVPKGTPMLAPQACAPSGETSQDFCNGCP